MLTGSSLSDEYQTTGRPENRLGFNRNVEAEQNEQGAREGKGSRKTE